MLKHQMSLQTSSASNIRKQIHQTHLSSILSVETKKMAIVKKNVAESPLERSTLPSFDQRLAMAKRCSHEGVMAGAKAAVVATVATAIPTFASVRMLPWARAHLNPTAQALIISTVAGAAYFIVADKTVLASARRNSYKQVPATLSAFEA